MWFDVRYVERGTTYVDEPSIEVDPGYYVVGVVGGDVEAEHVSLRVDHAVDEDDAEVDFEVAVLVAEALNRSRFAGGPALGDQVRHTVSRWQELLTVLGLRRAPRALCGAALEAAGSELDECWECRTRAGVRS